MGSMGSMGNFKGVMLCNRPNATDGMHNKPADASGVFRTGVSHEAVHPGGQDSDLKERLHKLHRPPRQATIIDKHKEYLKQLAEQREALLAEKEAEAARAAEKRAKLAESQRLLRELIRSQPDPVEGDDREDQYQYADDGYAADDGKPAAYTSTGAKARAGKGGKAGKTNKPAWARSEAVVEAEEEEEADELLNFADSLNYDKYVGQLEVRMFCGLLDYWLLFASCLFTHSSLFPVISFLQNKAGETLLSQRIAAVEAQEAEGRATLQRMEDEVAAEEQRAAAAAARRERREARRRRKHRRRHHHKKRSGAGEEAGAESKKESDGEHNGEEGGEESGSGSGSGTDTDGEHSRHGSSDDEGYVSSGADTVGSLRSAGGGGGRRDKRRGNDAASVATSILSSASSIRGVHSKRSLTALVERTTAGGVGGLSAAAATALGVGGGAMEQPKLVVLDDRAQAVEEKKNLVNTRPYQYQSPSV